MSATFNPEYRQPFEPLIPGFTFVPFNNAERLEQALTKDTAAVILEVVQGEGGVNIGRADYFKHVRELCDERGILLILDEIQTGFCRTGKMFACEHFAITPDMMCLAKSVAGGVPMGAVLCREEIKAPVGRHGTTFGGNPLACAASVAAIDFMLSENLAAEAQAKGEYLFKRLNSQDFGIVRDIRHMGLMFGIELTQKSKPVILKLLEQGVLALPAGSTVVRLLPPLTIERKMLEELAQRLIGVLESL